MLSQETIEKLSDILVKRIEDVNTFTIQEIARSLKKIKDLTPSQAEKLVQIFKYGGDFNKIKKALAKTTELNLKDIDKIFKNVAQKNQRFAKAFYEYKDKPFIPFDENIPLQRQVEAVRRITQAEYLGFARTIGFTKMINGKRIFTPIAQAYNEYLEQALLSVIQGKTTTDNVIRQIVKEMASSGLKVVEYDKTYIGKDGKEHPYVRRLDSAVRMNVLDGVRSLTNEINQQFGEEFGADGVEVSVHALPAPDHADIQGRQFSNEEFKKFQNDEICHDVNGIEYNPKFDGHDRRSISQYNCYHNIFPIVIGISEPQYTDEQLKAFKDQSNETFVLKKKMKNGKIRKHTYTKYQGTQMQRKLETEIRKAKDEQIGAVEIDDEQTIIESQERIKLLNKRYNELCNTANLTPRKDRMRVSGYKRKKVNNYDEIEYARKNNAIWHSTENLEEIIDSNKLISPSLAVGKKVNGKVKYGSQFIEFEPELLSNVTKDTKLYVGDGGNKYTRKAETFGNLMQMLKDNPTTYNELKFNDDIEINKYIKKVYVRQDEPQKVLDLLKENNINYEIYIDNRERGFKKKR